VTPRVRPTVSARAMAMSTRGKCTDMNQGWKQSQFDLHPLSLGDGDARETLDLKPRGIAVVGPDHGLHV
jgi:hypothetical protein